MSELYNLSEKVANLVTDTLLGDVGNDRVGWDIALQLMPTPQGPQPAIMVLLQMSSPVLGQNLNHMVFIDVNDLSSPGIVGSIKEGLEVLRTRRSELLAPGQLGSSLAAQRAAALDRQNGRP